MIFETKVHSIPCLCSVTNYSPYIPMRITGSGMGDADAPEGGEFDFDILDRRGRKAPWFEKYLQPADTDRLHEEFLYAVKAEEFSY